MKLTVQSSSSRPELRLLPFLFFLSGASSLIFETIFARLLTHTFGNTAHAVSTVLAAFLAGLAMGAALFGRWVDRRPPSLWIYGALELLIGAYCLLVPRLFSLVTSTYVFLYHWLDLGPTGLTLVRFLSAGVVILIPTVLMGATLPAVARVVAASYRNFEPALNRLYGWNTLGAATGTLVSTYLLMPTIGVRATIGVACAINFAIFLAVALAASKRLPSLSEAEKPVSLSHFSETINQRPGAFLLVGAFLSGAIVLAYEVIWTHVLAFLIGNTVYAFGVMLFIILCGLGGGAHLVSRYFSRPSAWGRALAGSQIFVGLAVFLSLPLWLRVPDLFARGLERALEFNLVSLAFLLLLRIVYLGSRLYKRFHSSNWPRWEVIELGVEVAALIGLLGLDTTWLWRHEATYFVIAELFRFFCAFFLLIVPALLMGASFPLLLNLYTHGARGVGKNVGAIYAANTVGTILGSVLTGFLILPAIGSHDALRGAAALNVILGLVFALTLVGLPRKSKLAFSLICVSLLLLLGQGPHTWDAKRMSRGSYVYFNAGWPIDAVHYFREDVHGGLTSVVQVGPSRVLLSNGKFQGNNTGEVSEQIRMALYPMLFTQGFDRALVIGLGTGNTLRSVSRFPFRHVDAVELAPHIVEAARLWFGDINGLVFDRDPRVRLAIADGRNFLLLSREQYDFITIEVSSIWISGEADLYNKEFYELCAERLTERGVLQQWVQIHHMRPQDFLVILNTAARVFPHLAFFLGPEQGILVASKAPLECDYGRIGGFDHDPQVKEELRTVNLPSMFSLLGELMLYGDSFHEAVTSLPQVSNLPADFVSTDFNRYLEYQTPRGNTLPYNTVPLNRNFLLPRRPAGLPLDMPIRNLSDEYERNLIMGYLLAQRGDREGALAYFQRVKGAAAERARREVARLQSEALLVK